MEKTRVTDYKYLEARLLELAEILQQASRATVDAFECLSDATSGGVEAVAKTIAMVDNLCDEIEEAHRIACDVTNALTEDD